MSRHFGIYTHPNVCDFLTPSASFPIHVQFTTTTRRLQQLRGVILPHCSTSATAGQCLLAMPRPSFVAAFAVMVALAAAATVQGANLRSPDATFGASNDANAAGCTSPDVTCCPNVDYPVFSVLAGSFCRGLEPVFQHVLNGNGLLHNRSHVRAPLLVPGRHLLWPPHFCLCVCVAVCVSVAVVVCSARMCLYVCGCVWLWLWLWLWLCVPGMQRSLRGDGLRHGCPGVLLIFLADRLQALPISVHQHARQVRRR